MQSSIFQNFKKYALSGLHRILSGQYNTTVHILGEGERAAPVFQKNLRKRKTASFSRIPGNICVLGQVLGDMWLMTPSRAKLGLIERGVSSGVSRGELWGISLIGSQSQLTLLIVSQKGWPDTFSVTFIASLTLVLTFAAILNFNGIVFGVRISTRLFLAFVEQFPFSLP